MLVVCLCIKINRYLFSVLYSSIHQRALAQWWLLEGVSVPIWKATWVRFALATGAFIFSLRRKGQSTTFFYIYSSIEFIMYNDQSNIDIWLVMFQITKGRDCSMASNSIFLNICLYGNIFFLGNLDLVVKLMQRIRWAMDLPDLWRL